MFGIGMNELLLVLALALIIIGPKKLPEIAKALGKGLAEFKRATEEFKNTINEESRVAETRDQLVREGKIQAPETDADTDVGTETDVAEPSAAPSAEEEVAASESVDRKPGPESGSEPAGKEVRGSSHDG